MSEEEKIEQQSTDNSTAPTENNNKISEAAIINEQPSTNMEVHKHPHHVTHKKKWGEYLLEFFMLFLAVFLGFIAENIREHSVEKDREKQFIRSLVYDIKADTARLNTIIKARTMRDISLDSLSQLMNSSSAAQYTIDIYFYAITVSRTLAIRFIPNDGTVQQLKNSGALRLISSREVVDSIAKYDVNVRNLLRQQEVEESTIHDYRQAAAKMFNALYFEDMMDADANPSRLTTGNPPLLNYAKTDLETWNYKLYGMKTISKANRRDAKLLLRQATHLLQTLQKQYRLKYE